MMLMDFLVRGLVGGLGVAAIAGPLGCFVIWQRMSYFGAAIAHAALFGVGLGLAFNIAPWLGIFIVSIAFAIGILFLEKRANLAYDTVLGIFAHISLAGGMIIISLMDTVRVDLMGYLFGSILTVTHQDLLWIYIGGSVVLLVLRAIWRDLLAVVIHEELASAEGVATERIKWFFTLLLATVIAISIKIVGVLLIVSLLIVPAAAARPLSRSPEQMAVWATAIGMLSVIGGLGASLLLDTASGPSIVVVAFIFFLLGQACRWCVNKPSNLK